MPDRILLALISLLWFNTTEAKSDTIVRFLNSRFQPSAESSALYKTKSVTKKSGSRWEVNDYEYHSGKLLMNSGFADSTLSIASGTYEVFGPEGQLLIHGAYRNDVRTGNWKQWHLNGQLSDSIVYDDSGNVKGIRKGWYSDGILRDSADYKNNGCANQISWHPNGVKRSEGLLVNEDKTGKWSYFFSSGKPAAEEIYIKDSTVFIRCFKENGEEYREGCVSEKIAEFPGGMDAWRNYLSEKVRAYQKMLKAEGGEGTVVVSFIIGTNGKVEDAAIENATGNYLEDFALQIIYTSPKWHAATQHNIPVQTYYRQPITFKRVD